MAIVVANKYRLGMDGDKFSPKFKTHLRSLKIEEDDLEEYNKSSAISGILYEVDKEATAKRNELLAPKPKKGRPSKNEKIEE